MIDRSDPVEAHWRFLKFAACRFFQAQPQLQVNLSLKVELALFPLIHHMTMTSIFGHNGRRHQFLGKMEDNLKFKKMEDYLNFTEETSILM